MDWINFKKNLFCIDRNLEIKELEFVCDEKMAPHSQSDADGDIAKVYQEIDPFMARPATRFVFLQCITNDRCPSFFLKKEDAIKCLLEDLTRERDYSIRAMNAKIKLYEDMLK